jgi:hypothetical protein|tara:strand:- start:849 stop:1043 length:195 start_codon:yes stop_codon:yes gene_type:complete
MPDYTYQFNRNEEITPTGGIIAEDVSTTIRGDNPTLEAVLSGVNTFVPSCGFNLNGSGIGLIAG